MVGKDVSVDGVFFHKVPDLEGLVGEEDGTFGAGELHPGGMAVFGPRAGGGFDDPTSAVFELDKSDAVVFYFDVFVSEKGGVGLHGLDGACEMKQGVHGVDRLVHERATAIEGPSATPSGRVIVGLVAIPLDISGGGSEFAKAACVDGGLEGVHPGVKATVEDGGKSFSVGGSGGDQFVATLGGDFEGFFDDSVLTCIEGRKGRVEVGSAGSADGDDFELGVAEKFCHIGKALGVVFFSEFVGPFLVEIEDRVESAARHGGDSFSVKVADHAGADDSEFHVDWF